MRTASERDGISDTFETFSVSALLPLVQRPSRYSDGELNLSNDGFREGRFNVLLVFPDVYEIGMSHLGIRFLYHALAAMEGVGVEFAFAPWPDAARLMRACGEPLRSLATGTPAARFDLIGFTVPYELHYTNLLMMLDLAGIPLEAAERSGSDPIIVAGGPCCSNPLPFLNAIDAVFLGDGEDSLREAAAALSRLKAEGAGRGAAREALARIEGVYVDGISASVKARTHRFEPGDLPRRPIVASSEIVHQRLAVEIMRGCARGCRFCHAGVFYRPCRERSVDEIMDAVLEGLDWTGWDEVSLLSLSTSDYSRLDELLARLVPELERRNVSLALPSLRPETITDAIVAASSTVTRSGFTLAPEAGTERLRRVVKKDFSDADIFEGVAKILSGGWQTLKLYLMIGLPTETESDLDGAALLISRILMLPRKGARFKLGVSISPFVPKPHTPFQWERQCSADEFRAKEEYLSRRIRSRFVNLSLREPTISVLEGILARGDRRLWPALRRAHDLGCRFDGWSSELRFDLWERALAESGLGIEALIAARPVDEPLPWDAFELHATKSLLRKERDRAYGADVPAPSPVAGAPMGPFAGISAPAAVSRPAVPTPVPSAAALKGPSLGTAASQREHFRYRVIFEKRGRERFLSHIETMNVVQRALRRSELPLHFTEGFHPHPRMSAGPSLAVGIEGFGEFFDVELVEEAALSTELLNRFLPPGIRVTACAGPFTRSEGKLPSEARYTYLLRFDALRKLLKSASAESEGLSETERMWYLLARELESGLSALPFAGGSPVDPARWFEAEWRRLFERGASLKNDKGKERSCAGCAVRLVDEPAAERGSAAEADGEPVGDALELVLPGGEGAPRPQDLLMAFIPKNIASLVRIQRLEIRYKCEEDFKDPVEMIARKPQKT
ncbi:MAG: TIGR03936 family radical SAM-associated protein [Candidatus Krumholzibacteria bacterium]|nr:TIGR03936 family radical SAM-associated protein [Candidatus Krumholzibacteria bacterium]